jgi:hypothetical protein
MTTTPPPIECTTIEQFSALAARAARPGGVTCVEMQHDSWCPGDTATCICNPHLLLHDLSAEPPVLLARLLAPTSAGGGTA